MDSKKEREIYEISPLFFEQALGCLDGTMNEMNTCMYWGCQCGNGWYEPIKEFAQKTKYLNDLARSNNIKFVCNTIKEKFGYFNCYWTARKIDENVPAIDNKILVSMLDQAIATCEDKCWKVCEICGSSEDLITTSGWISRICRKCAQNNYFSRCVELAKKNHSEYVPRITVFQEGFDFLAMDYQTVFKFEDSRYNSILDAFYSVKDPCHKKLWETLSYLRGFSMISRMVDIGREFGVMMLQEDYELLRRIVQARFTRNDHSVRLLKGTRGYQLVYTNVVHDNIYGQCVCDKCKKSVGKNLYGDILMKVRGIL